MKRFLVFFRILLAAMLLLLVCQLAGADGMPVKKVSISGPHKVSLFHTAQLTAKVLPASAAGEAVRWTSDDPATASVDDQGLVTGMSSGSTMIRAQCSGRADAYRVIVKEVAPRSLSFARKAITLTCGNTARAHVIYKPANTSRTELHYESDNPAICSIDEDGTLRGIAPGRTVVTAWNERYPTVKDTCCVYVISPGDKPLAGLTIGINPGHQKRPIMRLYRVAPHSRKKKPGCMLGSSGCVTHIPEYQTNLVIGLKLADLLREKGANVVMTRTDNDAYLNNIERAQMLNDAGADVALQLHCNAGPRYVHGIETYYRKSDTPYGADNLRLAQTLLRATCASTRRIPPWRAGDQQFHEPELFRDSSRADRDGVSHQRDRGQAAIR